MILKLKTLVSDHALTRGAFHWELASHVRMLYLAGLSFQVESVYV